MPLQTQWIRERRPQNELHYFPSLGSTMTEAARLAAEGLPHGTLVIADEQTAGIGRLGRSWQSKAELGLYCSILLRLPLPPDGLPLVTLVLGLAASEAIQKSTDLACDLRWPNDVLVGERKTAGILAQLVESCVVAGIGINVNQMAFPMDLRTPATSLRLESNGKMQSREALVVNLLESLDNFCRMLITEGPESILRAFCAASSYATNRRVQVEESGRKGITAGLDANGFLLIRFDNGIVERVAAGGVRPAHD
jgi:BirA family biotin operon repressor/biotin-[acetyl-CoA-carboxylase] ligase